MNFPDVHDPYSLIAFALLIAFQAFQIWQNAAIKSQGNVIEKQTNSLVDHTIQAAEAAMHAKGEAAGVIKEQARVAAKTALADEVAAHLQEIKQHGEP